MNEKNNKKYINDNFNRELDQLVEGKLDKRHIFNLSKPSTILLCCGFPANDNIELLAGQLQKKILQHGFTIKAIKGLVNALNNPIAVFSYGDIAKAQNVIVQLKHDDKFFLVGIHFNQTLRGTSISDIRGLLPKNTEEWLNWINQGKALYLNIKKIQGIISKRRINLAEVTYLDLDSIDRILKGNKTVNNYFPHK
jgi:DNA-binding transcriptional MerR regulator